MSLFNTEKTTKNNNNQQSGGTPSPSHNIIVEYKSHELVKVENSEGKEQDKLILNVKMVSDEFSDSFPEGTETTVSITNPQRAKNVNDYLDNTSEFFSSGAVFTLNSTRNNNGELSCYAVKRLTPSADADGFYVKTNQFVEVEPVTKDTADKPQQKFKHYMTDKAFTVIGKNSSNPFEGTPYEEVMEEHMGEFKDADALTKLAYIVEVMKSDPEVQAAQRFDIMFRAYKLNPDEDAEYGLLDQSNVEVVSMNGTIPQKEGEYTVHETASFSDLVDHYVENFDVSEVKNERYREVLETQHTSLSNLLSNINDLPEDEFFVEVMPVAHMKAGAAIKKEPEDKLNARNKQAAVFNPQTKGVNRNTGENYTTRVILGGTTLVTRESKNTDNHFVADFVSNVVSYGNNPGYTDESVRNKKNLPTRNSGLYPELAEAMSQNAKNSAEYFDQRNWDNNNENGNDAGEPDHDAEAEGPTPSP